VPTRSGCLSPPGGGTGAALYAPVHPVDFARPTWPRDLLQEPLPQSSAPQTVSARADNPKAYLFRAAIPPCLRLAGGAAGGPTEPLLTEPAAGAEVTNSTA